MVRTLTPADSTGAISSGRPGDPLDIAQAVACLASDRAPWVTRATRTVDGGDSPLI